MLPGGGTYFTNSNGYAVAGRHIFDIASEMNEEGNYFPVWGTCLGFELLLFLSGDGETKGDHRKDCSSINRARQLFFKDDFKESRMFKNATESVVSILERESVTFNYHKKCITEEVSVLLKVNELANTAVVHEIFRS